MEGDTALEMEALDVTAGAWEDLKREVLADDPDSVAPLFIGDSRMAGVFLCSGSAGCSCSGCFSCSSSSGNYMCCIPSSNS
jgi:hypothetical protein